MKYYILNNEGKEVSFDLNSKNKEENAIEVLDASLIRKDFYLRTIGEKNFISEDKISWEKLPFLSSYNNLVYYNENIKVYRGFKPSGLTKAKAGNLVSEMPGKIVKISCAEGSEVKAGDTLLILEAMKMENEIKADVSGKIKHININENQTVESGQVLIEIEE